MLLLVQKTMKLRLVTVSTLRLCSSFRSSFQDLAISPFSQKALSDTFNFTDMTSVQAASIPPILQGSDCLAKAKTGEGKTLAFLIPAAELLAKGEEKSEDYISSDFTQSRIPILIISPNRELAAQIATEANNLLEFHRMKKVVCVYGGRSVSGDVRALNSTVSMLIATPGRLLDLLENTPHLKNRLSEVKMVIMDEADRLMEMGFSREIKSIVSFLPKKECRQTVFFSATMPSTVRDIAKEHLRSDYLFLDTVGEHSCGQQTHQRVPQALVSVPTSDLLPAISAIIKQQQQLPNYKVIVFLTTARLTGYMATLFREMDMDVMEIHSRLTQARRTRVSEEFRQATGGVVLFSSDVSARGLDYPGVTHVLQVGSTDRSQYIHRLGRTARAGKDGSGTIVVFDYEEKAMTKELNDMPLTKTVLGEEELQTHRNIVSPVLALVGAGNHLSLEKLGSQAFSSFFGFYTNGWLTKFKMNKLELVNKGVEFSRALGLSKTPALSKKAVGMLGLKGLDGIVVENGGASKKPKHGRSGKSNDKRGGDASSVNGRKKRKEDYGKH